MPALNKPVTTITQDRFIPRVIDQIFDGNVLTMRWMRNQKPWRGGHKIVVPVNLHTITSGGSYFGFDVLSTTQENIRENAEFNPSQMYVSVPISGIQRAMNKGDAAVVDLIAAEMEFRTNWLKDEFGTQLYGDGTGNASKDILGIAAYIDDSTSVTTYGNLSRSTYSDWQATRTAQSGSLALSDLASDFDAAAFGADMPSLIVTTPAVWTFYEALITPTVSHNVGVREFRLTPEGSRPIENIGGNQGFRALSFRGVPVVADPKCTAGYIYTITEKYLDFYRVPQPTGFTVESERNGFGWTGWLQGVNQDAVVGRLQWYGQLVGLKPKTSAVRTGVTS